MTYEPDMLYFLPQFQLCLEYHDLVLRISSHAVHKSPTHPRTYHPLEEVQIICQDQAQNKIFESELLMQCSIMEVRTLLHVCSNHKFSTENIPVVIKLNALVFNFKREIEIERYLPPTCKEPMQAIIQKTYMIKEQENIITIFTCLFYERAPRNHSVIAFLQNLSILVTQPHHMFR